MEQLTKDNTQKLIDAFSDDGFQEKINQYRFDIESQLKKFIEWLSEELNPNQKIFHSPESRIKAKASFEEKIYRKDYINHWSLEGDTQDLQREILKNLPDIIGFRLTCFFIDDEEVIYEKLRKYAENNGFSNIQLDFSEGTQQQNGLPIYKVSGKYHNSVCFELQIKAAVHNVWGEVEHKTIYKGRQYSINHPERKTITHEIFNILKASDQQLLALFKSTYTQDDLLFALFAEQTRDKIQTEMKSEYLSGHYKSFFDIFYVQEKTNIKKYVISFLSDGETQYIRPELSREDSENEEYRSIANKIKATFKEYYMKVQFCIAKELHAFDEYDEFLCFLAKTILKNQATDDEEDTIEDDVFSDEDEIIKESSGEIALKVLEGKLPGARIKGE